MKANFVAVFTGVTASIWRDELRPVADAVIVGYPRVPVFTRISNPENAADPLMFTLAVTVVGTAPEVIATGAEGHVVVTVPGAMQTTPEGLEEVNGGVVGATADNTGFDEGAAAGTTNRANRNEKTKRSLLLIGPAQLAGFLYAAPESPPSTTIMSLRIQFD